MASLAAYARSKERVAKICGSTSDLTLLRVRLLDELRQVIGFDAFAWLLTDPETSVGSAPLAEVPCLPELPTLIRLKYLTDVNRWTTLGDPSVDTLRGATGGDLSRSRLWRDLLTGFDVGDVLSGVFRDRFGCWGFLDLWRMGDGFSQSEVGLLTDLTAPITHALRTGQAARFSAPPERDPGPGPVVLVLSPDLRVLGQTPQTPQYLRVLVPPPPDRPPIPASAYNVAAQLLAVEEGLDLNPPQARVHLSGSRWLTLKAARIDDSDTPAQQSIAVTIAEATPDERVTLFARAFGFSPRETELLSRLATGVDTRQLARQLFLSEHTVQDHLKSIFAKTSTHSRGALLSKALGT